MHNMSFTNACFLAFSSYQYSLLHFWIAISSLPSLSGFPLLPLAPLFFFSSIHLLSFVFKSSTFIISVSLSHSAKLIFFFNSYFVSIVLIFLSLPCHLLLFLFLYLIDILFFLHLFMLLLFIICLFDHLFCHLLFKLHLSHIGLLDLGVVSCVVVNCGSGFARSWTFGGHWYGIFLLWHTKQSVPVLQSPQLSGRMNN